MGLTKYKLGNLVELFSKACNIPNLKEKDVSGINKDKEFFEPAKQVGSDTRKYQIVPPYYFACNLMHVGRDEVLPISLNHTEQDKIVSPAYTVFSVNNNVLLNNYLFILLKSEEQDRYFWFHTDASVRDGMSWADFCDLEIELPDIAIQQKYVNIYQTMLANQQTYERGLKDLKFLCDGYIEDLRKRYESQAIGDYIQLKETKNIGLQYGLDAVRGISINKKFISSKADMKNVSLENYLIVSPLDFCYVTVTSRNGDKISLALNDSELTYLCSNTYISFKVKNKELLLPEYLMMWFKRSEFDRYARFHSWGSAREIFTWNDLENVKIPIPELEIQQSIVDIYKSYIKRKEINEKLKAQIKDSCPILIKGALEEARK